MENLKTAELELKLLKSGLNTYFDENGSPKIEYGEIVEMVKLVKEKDLEVYKLREWVKLENKADELCRDCPKINRPDIIKKYLGEIE